MRYVFYVTGAIADGSTILLDEPLPVASGRVRLTIEFADGAEFGPSLCEFLDDLRRRVAACRCGPPPPEEEAARRLVARSVWFD